MTDDFTGYDILTHGAADRAAFAASSIEFSYAAPNTLNHRALDPTPNLRRENQGSWPSCTGHGITTAAETIGGLQMGDFKKIKQLSRKFAWENGQKHWIGKVDWQQGCSIQHVVQALAEDGIPEESYAPYNFEARKLSLTPEAYNAAKLIRIGNTVDLSNEPAERWLQFLDGGFGAIVFGVLLPRAFFKCSGQLTLKHVTEDGGRSGHCMCLVGFNEKQELRLENSWLNWGDQYGAANVPLECVEYWRKRPYTVAIGLTDLSGFEKPRLLKEWLMGGNENLAQVSDDGKKLQHWGVG